MRFPSVFAMITACEVGMLNVSTIRDFFHLSSFESSLLERTRVQSSAAVAPEMTTGSVGRRNGLLFFNADSVWGLI